jgi:N6-adenosine-specific RNA methylase IME4
MGIAAYSTGDLVADLAEYAPFGTVYADCPWPNPGGKKSNSRMSHMRALHTYSTMKEKDLLEMPVGLLAAPNAMLVMWCTWMHLELAMRVIPAWGFKYCTGKPWLKRTVNGKIAYGPGTWFLQCTELLLIARRGKPFGSNGNPRPATKGLIDAPRGEHSAKPPEVRDWCLAKLPGPHLELFARSTHPGWVSWGNQL